MIYHVSPLVSLLMLLPPLIYIDDALQRMGEDGKNLGWEEGREIQRNGIREPWPPLSTPRKDPMSHMANKDLRSWQEELKWLEEEVSSKTENRKSWVQLQSGRWLCGY